MSFLGRLKGIQRQQGMAGIGTTQPIAMPRMGMMGGRGMAAEIARRAGVMGPQVGGGAANATSIGERANVQKKAKGGKVKKMAKGGSTASKRADGCASKGKTKGRFV